MSVINYLSFIIGIAIGYPDFNTEKVSDSTNITRNLQAHKSGEIEIISLHTGTEFRFKGMAVDVTGGKVYLGSWDKKEIVMADLKEGKHTLIKTNYSGRLNGMGVYLRDKKLYAVMNEVNDDPLANPVSVLLVIDVATNKVLHCYEARSKNGRHHFNHVVVDNQGIAYISNTLKSGIYTVNTHDPRDTLKELVVHADLSWVHGIDISPDGSKLFSTSYDGGIKFFDLKSKTFLAYRDTRTSGNDGLKYYKGYLYGIGRNSLKRYTLNQTEDAIIMTDTLISGHPFFNDPRCLHIEDDWIYCLANIDFQIVDFGNAVQNRKGKKPFTDTYILKFRI